jgi:hypothetical protein
VIRVQKWRKAHPGYWREKASPLQDAIIEQPVEHQGDKLDLVERALQDEFLTQPALLVGVIATLTGCALQDDIAQTIRQLHHRGQTILNPKLGIEKKGTEHAGKAFVMSG